MFDISNLPGESAQLLYYLPSIGIPRSTLLRRDDVYSKSPIYLTLSYHLGFPWWLSSKESAYNAGEAGDAGSVPGSRRPPGGRHGYPLQYSCLGNAMDRGAWQAIEHRVTKSCTRLQRLSIHPVRLPFTSNASL